MGARLAELKAMFAHLRGEVGTAGTVIGASWLYNLEAYRRLFPPEYLQTARTGGDDFAYLPLWGQFVDHAGCVKEGLATEFLERLGRQRSMDGIERCFPFQVLHLESPIEGRPLGDSGVVSTTSQSRVWVGASALSCCCCIWYRRSAWRNCG